MIFFGVEPDADEVLHVGVSLHQVEKAQSLLLLPDLALVHNFILVGGCYDTIIGENACGKGCRTSVRDVVPVNKFFLLIILRIILKTKTRAQEKTF